MTAGSAWKIVGSGCLLLLATSQLSANWPSFRGAAGGTAPGNPPTAWDLARGTNVAWKTAISGLGHSSPVVWGDRVYVTSAVSSTGEDEFKNGRGAGIASATDIGTQEWRLYAIDRRTGKIIWQRTAAQSAPLAQRHVKNSYATATPATDGKHIVAVMGSQGLFCYDASGRLLWRKELGTLDLGMAKDPGTRYGSGSSPVIDGTRVIIQNDRRQDSSLAAYDIASGNEIWRSPRDEQSSWATPLVARVGSRALVITNSPQRVRAHDLATGQEIWWMDEGTELKIPTPVLAGDAVIVTGGFPSGSKPIFAIPLAASGEVRATDLRWKVERGSSYTMTPLVYDGLLYVGGDNGVLSAYDVTTGERIYQTRLGEGTSSFSASPIAASGRLYVVSEDGNVYTVRAGRTFELLATNSLDAVTLATPAIDGNLLIIRTRTQLVALGQP